MLLVWNKVYVIGKEFVGVGLIFMVLNLEFVYEIKCCVFLRIFVKFFDCVCNIFVFYGIIFFGF